MVNKVCLWWANCIILNKGTPEHWAWRICSQPYSRIYTENWLIYALLNVRCTALIQKKTVCLLSISIHMSAQMWQRLSILHHRNVPGSTFHLATFATFHKSSNYLRPGIDGWTQLCCMCQCALYHSWYRTHQNTSTILLSWFSCAFCVYYHWFRIESASRSLIQSTYSLLWWN